MGKKQLKSIKKPAAIKDESATVADSCLNGECCMFLEHSVIALRNEKVAAHKKAREYQHSIVYDGAYDLVQTLPQQKLKTVTLRSTRSVA